MSELRERQKAEAVERMKKLHIMEQPMKEFEEEGKLNLSENGGFLYWLNDEEQKMAADFERKNHGLVYHVVKNLSTIGTMYSLLYVSENEDEWKMDMKVLEDGEAFVYIVNVDAPDCSEFGTIGIKPCI